MPEPPAAAARPRPRRRTDRSATAVLAPLLAGGLAALSLACGGDGARPVPGGTAVLVQPGVPRTANPLLAADAYSQELTQRLLFLPMLERDSTLALAPRLAESWSVAGDTAITFLIRPGIRWSDGRPVTARDVAATYRRALDPATGYPNRQRLDHILEVAAPDSLTVTWRVRPARDPLAAATLPVMPAHVLDTIPPAGLQSAPFNLAPVTSGPFHVADVRPNDRWVLARNEGFPESLGGPPLLDRLVWRGVAETAAQVAELRTGEADIAVGVNPEAATQLDSATFRRRHRPIPRYTTVAWNNRRPPLDDGRVRTALGLAMDRRSILEGLRGGHGQPAAGPIPPDHWTHAPSVRPLPFDTARARRMLDEAGLVDRDGDGVRDLPTGGELRLTLLHPAGSDFNRDLAQVLQDQLGRVGVRLEPRAVEFSTLVGIITGPDRDFDAVLLALDTDPRIDLRGLFHSASLDGPFQLAGFRSARLDAVLDSIEAMPSSEAALPLWQRAQRLIAEAQPWAFLYHGTELVVVRDGLEGVRSDLRGVLWSAADWWLRDAARSDPEPAGGGG